MIELSETERRLNQAEADIINLRRNKADDIELHPNGTVNLLSMNSKIGSAVDFDEQFGKELTVKFLD